MNEDGQPVTRAELSLYPTREELQQTLDRALARYVTKNEFSEFVQLVIDEQERSARRHDQLVQMITATEQRLEQRLEQRFEQRLEQRIAATEQRLVATEQRLMVEIGRAARVAAEEHRRELGVLDDRYRDLPGRVSKLERDLDEHRRDAAAHGRPRRPGRKR
jgi:hypothetical protein